MSLMDRMKEGFLTLFGTTQRTSHLPSLLQVSRNIKSSSSMKQTIPLPMYNSFSERLLRSSPENCRFIFTCNYKNKIIDPLHSRCTVIDFNVNKKDKPTIAAGFFQRIIEILELERISYDKKVIIELINKHFPDWRRVLNECQRYSVGGEIDSGILASFSDVSINDLTKNLKEKNFSEVRKWVNTNMDNDTSLLFRRIYDSLYETLVVSSIPAAVLVLAKYQFQVAFVADQEINMLACLTELMVECEFK